MAKKATLSTISTGYNSLATLNANLEAINDKLDNTVSRDGSSPNAMEADLDLNNKNILNANTVSSGSFYRQGVELVPTDLAGVTYPQYNYGSTNSVSRDVPVRLKDRVSIQDWGAVGDGSDSTTAFVNCVTDLSDRDEVYIPPGNYTVTISSVETAAGSKRFIWSGPGKINGANTKNLPGINFDVAGDRLTIRNDSDISQPDDFALFEIVRTVDHTDSADQLSSALRVETTVSASSGASALFTTREWAINGVISNSSPELHAVATSGVATANDEGPVWALHGNTIDLKTGRTVNVVRAAELNIQASDADSNYKRVVLDVLSKANAGAVSPSISTGIRISTSGADFINAVDITQGSDAYQNSIIRVNASPSLSVLQHQSGSAQYGIVLRGTYSSAALGLGDNDVISLRSNDTAKMYFDTATLQMKWLIAGIDRVALEIDPSPRILLNSVQVLGERKTGWTAATNTTSRATFDTTTVTTAQLAQRVKALIDDLISHGIIGA